MPRTRAHRNEVTVPDPAPEEQAESPQAPPLPPALPGVNTHPAVVEAGRRLAEADAKLVAAAKHTGEVAEQVEAARDRLRELEKLLVLDEVSAGEVEAARTDLVRLEPGLADAQAVARSWRDAVEDLATRVERATAQARQEITEALNSERLELGRRIGVTLAELAPVAHRLFMLEDAARRQGLRLDGPSLAPAELVFAKEPASIQHIDYKFHYDPRDGSLVMFYLRRLQAMGLDVPEPQGVSLRDLISSGW